MERKQRIMLTAAVAAGVLGAAGGTAAATAGEPERPITGDALRQASEAALAHTGSGRVTGTEDGDEESRYEVEVTLAGGRQVDVQLDDRFAVVGSSADEHPDDESGGSGDGGSGDG
jgi:hypothetical protein